MTMARFEGIIPAVTTPFTADDQVDVPALKENVEKLIEAGVHGFVATGTMGEAGSLTREERALVVRSVVEAADGRVPVTVGVSSGSAKQSLEYAARDQAAADVVQPHELVNLVQCEEWIHECSCSAPYYSNPSSGLSQCTRCATSLSAESPPHPALNGGGPSGREIQNETEGFTTKGCRLRK